MARNLRFGFNDGAWTCLAVLAVGLSFCGIPTKPSQSTTTLASRENASYEDDHHPSLVLYSAARPCVLSQRLGFVWHATPRYLQRLDAGHDARPRGIFVGAEWHLPITQRVGVQEHAVRLLDDLHVDLDPLVVRREVRLGGGR